MFLQYSLSHSWTIGLAHLLTLPPEILDQILSEIDLRIDLISLALASQACYHLVIPRHSEYRIIRTRHRLAAMWAHLARRSDLARNIRKVHLCFKDNQMAPDQYPTTLVPKGLSSREELDHERNRMANICQALRHMKLVEEFVWENDRDSHPQSRIIPSCFEGDILEALGRCEKLNRLALAGHMKLRPLDPTRQLEEVWNIRNLQYVSLRGEIWALPSMGATVREFLKQSPLKYLEIPLEITSLANTFLPHLRQLRLFLQSGASSSSVKAWSAFLANHPALEELSCCPPLVTFPVDGLPNLKTLQTDLNALGEFASTAQLSLDSVDAIHPLSDLGEKFLWSGSCSNLRKLRLANWPEVFLPTSLPNLTWLSIAQCPEMDLDIVLEYLSNFPRLEVFRGPAIWKSVDYDELKMHTAIFQLLGKCPNIQELDHKTYYAKRQAYKRIVFIREPNPDGSLSIRYQVEKPLPRLLFDTAGGVL